MTDVLHIHGRDQKGKPSYTKTTLGGPRVEPATDLKAIEAEIARALWNAPVIPFKAPEKDLA